MKALEDKIKEQGKVIAGDILKVDAFLNHQIDVDLMMQMGKDIYNYYSDRPITKVLTLEVSGIAIAMAVAHYFKVPMVFAKKSQSLTLSDPTYVSQAYSYTKEKNYQVRVDQAYLSSSDCVLIVDDFLANGQALKALINLVKQAGGQVGGIGIAIEKCFQAGGQELRQEGYHIYSLARIAGFENGQVIFEGENEPKNN